MWGAISRLFHKQNGTNRNSNEELIMDKGEPRKFQESEPETYGTRQVSDKINISTFLY